MQVPVTKGASARYSTARAMSSGVPMRPRGICWTIRSRAGLPSAWWASVGQATVPGATELTRIGASSVARARVAISSPAFATQ